MDYRAPVGEIAFALKHVAGMANDLAEGLHGDLSEDLVDAVLEEAGRFASDELAPSNRQGDLEGAQFDNGKVKTPAGWPGLYRAWCDGGWNGLLASEEYGGQDLPVALWAATSEMWAAANMAFGLAPVLTQGAAEALASHGTEELKSLYLSKLVSGEWTGTMNLTEPQAGSDLAGLKARAERAEDGTYKIFGQKIFITYGEHDLTDNIIHFVLARLPDAPPGTKGISLFLVPKRLPSGEANDLRCHSIEHKMGIHASPTCTMIYGDKGGAKGFLVGEEHRGLACMFTMMNNARLAVGLEGVAVAERATQAALAFARQRLQGSAVSAARSPNWTAASGKMVPIAEHPDVKRMLMTMRALTWAARAICYRTATALDRARRGPDEASRHRAQERANLLTPIAKAFSTDIGIEVASIGIQVHGGMGFIEETGVAQYLRDARIAAIYEGTNGIQAIDLVMRKLPQSGGDCVRDTIAELRATVTEVASSNAPELGDTAERLDAAVKALNEATRWLMAESRTPEEKLSGATPYLRLFSLTAGGCALADGALMSMRMGNGENNAARVAITRYFAENLSTEAPGLARTIVDGAGSLTGPGVEAALAI